MVFDKSDAIAFGTSKLIVILPKTAAINVGGSDVTFSNRMKTLGVTLDSCLSFNNHVSTVCKSCLYYIKALRHIRTTLTIDVSFTLATALVQSRLGCANSFLYNTTAKTPNNSKHCRKNNFFHPISEPWQEKFFQIDIGFQSINESTSKLP